MADWIGSLCDALEFIGGVPELLVPDNPRALIARPDRYEPGLGTTTQDFVNHYGTAMLPARARKPQDKAKVEVGVLNRPGFVGERRVWRYAARAESTRFRL
jgi:transposase